MQHSNLRQHNRKSLCRQMGAKAVVCIIIIFLHNNFFFWQPLELVHFTFSLLFVCFCISCYVSKSTNNLTFQERIRSPKDQRWALMSRERPLRRMGWKVIQYLRMRYADRKKTQMPNYDRNGWFPMQLVDAWSMPIQFSPRMKSRNDILSSEALLKPLDSWFWQIVHQSISIRPQTHSSLLL